ncbi:hypothetical protein RRG08_009708 [Elysia crispata]|uniref:Uncharacterized protein n=1 Tax=Elysia crispata TaxID=231223 RepID=A0AAE1DIN5_9GAST|nr:hypothetical protein RRG08_009708 [Elysia crispata]
MISAKYESCGTVRNPNKHTGFPLGSFQRERRARGINRSTLDVVKLLVADSVLACTLASGLASKAASHQLTISHAHHHRLASRAASHMLDAERSISSYIVVVESTHIFFLSSVMWIKFHALCVAFSEL